MRYLVAGILIFSGLQIIGQDKRIDAIYSESVRISTDQYEADTSHDFIELRSAFSQNVVENVPVKEQRIIRIDLVYTAFRESQQFSQEELNKERISRLITSNPHLLENKFFEWRLVEQTGCNSPGSCRDFYHGFVVYYDKYYTKEDTRKEIDTIRQEMNTLDYTLARYDSLKRYQVNNYSCTFPPLNVSNQFLSDEFKKYYECSERFTGKVFFDVAVDNKGKPVQVNIKGTLFPCKEVTENILKYILRWKRGITIEGTSYPFYARGMIEFPLQRECITISEYIPPQELQEKFNMEIRGFACEAYTVDTFYTEIIPKIQKEAVSTVLFRNNWEDNLIIVDATGSMYPYTSDLLKWIRLKTLDRERTFVFFNDGNDKPTSHKVIGKTGGIYHINSSSYHEVRDMLFRSMREGGGGDLYENNFEALLYGTSLTSGAEDAIMIADNHSFPRDQELLRNYSGNLKIILCGTEYGINTYYLNLAYLHGFSIHTMTTDLRDLKHMKQGQSIKIDSREYVLGPNGFNPLIR